MIDIQVGVASPRTLQEIVNDAEYAKQLSGDKRFVRMILAAADRITNEWSRSQTLEKREELWQTFQGLQRFVREMNTDMEHGVEATLKLAETAQGMSDTEVSVSDKETRPLKPETAAQEDTDSPRARFEARQRLYDANVARERGAPGSTDQPSSPA